MDGSDDAPFDRTSLHLMIVGFESCGFELIRDPFDELIWTVIIRDRTARISSLK